MWLHRTQSFCVVVPGCFLLSILLTTTPLSIPSLRKDTLLCFYCPLQLKPEPCPFITTRCLPDEVCANSHGYHGAIQVVSAQGCIKRHLCGSHGFQFRLGVRYNVSHTCCCKDTCNHFLPMSERSVSVTISVVQEEPFDSCANYTSPPMFKSENE
ncbi:protein Bouncer-like [Boleophthalmus pectinirostris]|uniref:protein Bouncer-like n=1 Tax=Boleophthalmus pectinirostris TaxID=150288 RepID=UPI00242BCCD1|nr:protein Bouncer-like [Boleophthalmus pectinirostris]